MVCIVNQSTSINQYGILIYYVCINAVLFSVMSCVRHVDDKVCSRSDCHSICFITKANLLY